MPLPEVYITFSQLASSAFKRSERGILAILLKDAAGQAGVYTLTDATQIPSGLSTANKTYLQQAFVGGENAPLKLLVRVGNSATESDWSASLAWAETVKFDYLVAPTAVSGDLATINTWVTTQRTNNKLIRYVSANNAADKEYIYNFTTASITMNDSTTPSTASFCARMAGLIAGTPLSQSITYVPLLDVKSVESLTKTQMNTRIDNGEIILFHDGEKVKVARGMTSLKTLTPTKGSKFQKVKIVETLDLIANDIRKNIEDNYIGKVPNGYENKLQLVVAIGSYLQGLETEQLLAPDKNTVEIDLLAQKTYLTSQGIDTSTMTDQEIKEAETGDQIFIKMAITVLDAMETFNLAVSI
ncbi:phage tail sheath protein [Bacillus sp. AFS002410]|uniref:phage tail sheath subtilisin-like domain-containing protein n=1 Tax=Bacillus sp. AFS002410 TaxID=2033481 RepID=UPI000BF1D6A5|nr:phage tail sheath subtilisin-like domain-containing protein [Bacillus sp. AFS002410]PEJ57400.1 phage tail sheath protein [Bacillus sp. AFS002410]